MEFIKKQAKWFGVRYAIILCVTIAVTGFVAYEVVAYAHRNGPVAYIEVIKEVAPPRDYPPILEAIAKCESGSKQYKANGDVLRGKVEPSDIGYLQINETIWNDIARRMKIDIYTLEGNMAMGEYILNNYGTGAWSSSVKCWKK